MRDFVCDICGEHKATWHIRQTYYNLGDKKFKPRKYINVCSKCAKEWDKFVDRRKK